MNAKTPRTPRRSANENGENALATDGAQMDTDEEQGFVSVPCLCLSVFIRAPSVAGSALSWRLFSWRLGVHHPLHPVTARHRIPTTCSYAFPHAPSRKNRVGAFGCPTNGRSTHPI